MYIVLTLNYVTGKVYNYLLAFWERLLTGNKCHGARIDATAA